MRGDQVPPAFDDFDEIPLVANDRAVGIAFCLLDLDGAIVHGDKPATHLVDFEKVGSVDAAQKWLILLHSMKVEYFLGGVWHVVCPPFSIVASNQPRVAPGLEKGPIASANHRSAGRIKSDAPFGLTLVRA